MIQLLISIRSAAEVPAALAGATDLIDVKDPAAGAMGAASAKIWREVAKAAQETVPLSAALGELLDFNGKIPAASLAGYNFAKFGLAGCSDNPKWKAIWKQACAALPNEVHRVAVAYADSATARAPIASEVLKTAIQLHCRVFMIDTFQKGEADLFDFMPGREVRELFEEAIEAGMITVLAGSLRLGRISEILEIRPDIVAIRGGACVGGREGAISEELVKIWKVKLSRKQRGPRAHAAFK